MQARKIREILRSMPKRKRDAEEIREEQKKAK
jgi:hypothetical protein